MFRTFCLVMVLLAVCTSGCDFKGAVGVTDVVNAVDEFKNELDQGIQQIHKDSTQWQAVVKELSEKMPKEVNETIRVEMDGLVQRSIARTGVEFRCNIDFLGQRAVGGLERIKALLTNKEPAPLQPYFCQVSPGTIDLNLSPERRRTILMSGWDLNVKDANGDRMKVYLVPQGGGAPIELDGSRIGWTTHYEVSISVDGADLERIFRENRVVKLQCSWNKTTDGFPEVLVQQRVARKKSDPRPLGQITHTPKRVGNGDPDFDTSSGNPMHVTVAGESRVLDNRIETRAYMHAREHEDDFTEVRSWSNETADGKEGPWQVAYTAPTGWRIVSVSPLGRTEAKMDIADHQEHDINRAQGEVVTRFHIWGDTDDDEAGTYTRVQVYFNDVDIELEEVLP